MLGRWFRGSYCVTIGDPRSSRVCRCDRRNPLPLPYTKTPSRHYKSTETTFHIPLIEAEAQKAARALPLLTAVATRLSYCTRTRHERALPKYRESCGACV